MKVSIINSIFVTIFSLIAIIESLEKHDILKLEVFDTDCSGKLL